MADKTNLRRPQKDKTLLVGSGSGSGRRRRRSGDTKAAKASNHN